MKWYEPHPNEKWFGSCVVVTRNSNSPPSPCSFLPLERIHSLCAYGEISLLFNDLFSESVIVAIPIHNH